MENRTVRDVIKEMVINKNQTVTELADMLGCSDNSLYRYGLDGDSGTDMPVSKVIPLTHATRNLALIKHLANSCGCIVIKIPFKSTRQNKLQVAQEYQSAIADYDKIKSGLQELLDHCLENIIKNEQTEMEL
jgi:hypothetical protein